MPNDDDGQDHLFRFIPLKEVNSSATFGEVATPKVLHDMTISRSTEASMLTTRNFEKQLSIFFKTISGDA